MKIAAFILFYFLFFSAIAQTTINPVNVIPLDSHLTIPEILTKKFLLYKFILIGEMHGTEEPVTFMDEIAKTLSEKHKILVGFEIPADEINLTSKQLNYKNLAESDAFKARSQGRNSESWLRAILEINKLKNTKSFFYDATKKQASLQRDSAMFLNILKEYLKDTTAIIITISGNIHNQLFPYQNKKTMGYYINQFKHGKVLSVNHLYDNGTMFNNSDSLRLKMIENNAPVIKTISKSENFFYMDEHNAFSKQWNSFLFTTKINASFPVKNK